MSVRHERDPVVGLSGFKLQMAVLQQRSENTIKCDMCDRVVILRNSTPQQLAEEVYFNYSWRVQNGQMLCGYCTDDKR